MASGRRVAVHTRSDGGELRASMWGAFVRLAVPIGAAAKYPCFFLRGLPAVSLGLLR